MTELLHVPWLSRGEIAGRVEGLWDRFSRAGRVSRSAPVPVEDLLEFVGLSLDYDDLEEILGMPDVLGATWVSRRMVLIDHRLLDGVEGRRAFTCAHELGHWELHRHLVETAGRVERRAPAIFCRKQDARQPIEWQADYFAACLLMPEEPVRQAFERCFGLQPLIMRNEKSCYGRKTFFAPGRGIVVDPALDTAGEIAGCVIEAGGFSNVSREAMRIRLEDLSLLVDRVIRSRPSEPWRMGS